MTIQVEGYVRPDGTNPSEGGSTVWTPSQREGRCRDPANGPGQHFEREVVLGYRGIQDRLGPGYRLYLAKDGAKLIVLFGGGTKKGQERDIASALALHQEYKNRKAAAVQKPAARHKKKR